MCGVVVHVVVVVVVLVVAVMGIASAAAAAADFVSVVVEAEEPVGEGRVGGVRPLVVVVVGHGHGHPAAADAVLAARPREGRRHLHFPSAADF